MKKVKIQFIKHPGRFRLAYFPGEFAEMEEKQAEELCLAGVAGYAAEGYSELPEDIPARDVLVKLNLSLDELKQIEDYTELQGIGKATSQKLIKYFNK